MKSRIHTTLSLLQVDRTLLLALGSRIWQAVSGPITIWLIYLHLTESQQGVYYGLVSIVGIQAFFELGLLNVLISQAGHAQAAIEAAEAANDKTDVAEAPRQRMASLIHASSQWFAGMGILFAVAAVGFGWVTFSTSDAPDGWQTPLLFLVPLSALTVYLSPSLAIVEGSGDRQLVYQIRFVQMFIGSLVVWACLALGWGVWSLVMASVIQVGCTASVPLCFRRKLFRQARGAAGGDGFSWSREVLPSQWRIAVMSAAFHFATQLFPIILLAFHTSVEAGQLGMTLTITAAIQMLALAWAQTKYAVISKQHGSGDRESAGVMWRRTAVISACVLVLGFGTLAALIPATGWYRADLPTRFVHWTQVLWLGVGTLASHAIALQGFYVLSRGGRPFVVASLVGSAAIAAAVWGLGILYSTPGIVIGYALATSLVSLPAHTWAYLRYRRE
ncbi:MAG: hypothetical protein AAGA03_16395 [Planctomycetota bacterium]